MAAEQRMNTPEGNTFATKLRLAVCETFPNAATDADQCGEAIGLLTELAARIGIAYGVETGATPENVIGSLVDTMVLNFKILLAEIQSGIHTQQ